MPFEDTVIRLDVTWDLDLGARFAGKDVFGIALGLDDLGRIFMPTDKDLRATRGED